MPGKKTAITSPPTYLYQRIVQAKLYIDEHAIEHIDLGNIADTACFSKFHFLRLFKKSYGCSPYHYLLRKRIAIAKLRLAQQYPVTDTCMHIGFESIGYFSALFKKHTGMSPVVYKRQMGLRKRSIQDAPLHFIPGCFAEKSNFHQPAAPDGIETSTKTC